MDDNKSLITPKELRYENLMVKIGGEWYYGSVYSSNVLSNFWMTEYWFGNPFEQIMLRRVTQDFGRDVNKFEQELIEDFQICKSS